jgi:hypothetical protein
MARWQDVIDTAPEYAQAVQALFDAGRHKTLATLRKDGAPRISGIEAQFADGQLWLGMMANSQKLADVKRDPRIAMHSPSTEPPEDPTDSAGWTGDAKLSGRLVVMDDEMRKAVDPETPNSEQEGPPGDYFTVDIDEVVMTRLGTPADHLDIVLWRPGQPLKTMRA